MDYGGHWQMEIAAHIAEDYCEPEKSWAPKDNKGLLHCWDPIPGHEPQPLGDQVPFVQQGSNVCLTSHCLTEDKV